VLSSEIVYTALGNRLGVIIPLTYVNIKSNFTDFLRFLYNINMNLIKICDIQSKDFSLDVM